MEKTFEQAAPQPKIYEEDLVMVQHMIADPDYARDYFLEGEDIKLTCLSCAKVARGAYKDLKECTEEDIRTLMYEYFCWNGDMKKLESYKGIGKFKNWAHTSVMHHVFRFYDSMGYRRPRKVTKGNSKLAIARLHPKTKAYVVNLVDVPELNEILWLNYLEKKSIEEISKEMKHPVEVCEVMLALAKETLHLTILATEDDELINLTLSTSVRKDPQDVDKVVLTDSGDDTNPTTVALRTAIKEKFGIDYKDPNYLFQVQDFIVNCANEMKPENNRCRNWDRDRDIWFQRYLDNEPAKDIAEKYGIESANVDNIKSRFEARLREYLRNIFKDYIDEE